MLKSLLLKVLLFAVIPATEDTRADLDCFEIINTNNDTIEVAAPANHAAGDFQIWGPYCGIWNSDVLLGAEGSLRVKDGIGVLTSQIAAGAVFATAGQEVWYNPITDQFTDTEAAGLFGVGPLGAEMNADGVIAFYKRRYWIANSFDT